MQELPNLHGVVSRLLWEDTDGRIQETHFQGSCQHDSRRRS